jgi:hypothetical protein
MNRTMMISFHWGAALTNRSSDLAEEKIHSADDGRDYVPRQ